MNASTDLDLQAAVSNDYMALADLLDGLPESGWDAHFGFDLDGISLCATDMDWGFGTGTRITAAAEDLALLLCGRSVPPDRVDGPQPRR